MTKFLIPVLIFLLIIYFINKAFDMVFRFLRGGKKTNANRDRKENIHRKPPKVEKIKKEDIIEAEFEVIESGSERTENKPDAR